MSAIQLIADPSQAGPKMRIDTGAVVNNAAVYSTVLPNIAGAASPWSIVPSSTSSTPSIPTDNAFMQIMLADSQPGAQQSWSSESLTSSVGTPSTE